jgi:gag-polypeptide of LTR copia-type/Pol polyprotein, beta-barrel domain/Integrase core domain/Domain of unknown function (DUF4219)/GAG-pre-integrase domain/Zinc knuckle
MSLANTNNSYKIEPLNGDNYATWRRRLEWILDDQELWDITIGTEAEPTPVDPKNVSSAEGQAIADWKKKDKKARKEICLRISDEHLVYIDQFMGSHAIWTRLQDIFESKGAVGIVNLRRDFFRTFAEDGANMEEHVRKLRGLGQELSARGQLITDTDFSNTLLTSLPDSWSSFITAVNAGGIAISSDVLIARILDEDRVRQAGSTRQTALRTQSRDDSGATKGKCRNCGKKGHYVRDCWAQGGGKEGQAPSWYKTKNETAKQADENDFAFMVNDIALISTSASDWLADSAASTHIARNRNDFSAYTTDSTVIDGITPGASLRTQGRGTVPLEFKVGTDIFTIKLNDVKHAPEAPNNLISIGRLTDIGHSATFTSIGVEFKSKSGTVFGMGRKVGRMYQVRCRVIANRGAREFIAVAEARTMDKWHRILGHVNPWTIQTIKGNDLVDGLIIDESQAPTQCTACIQGKRHVDPFPKDAKETAQVPGDLVVSDVWGPAQTEGPAREKYFYSFTDAKTRYSTVYFGNTKDEALKNFASFKSFIETQTGNKVKRFRSDNGGEYTSKAFKEYCATLGIIMETTAPYSPAQNGIAERLNRTLLEHARAMIFAKGLPKVLWPEAVAYACYIKNRSPT